jgi:hypothetical protein
LGHNRHQFVFFDDWIGRSVFVTPRGFSYQKARRAEYIFTILLSFFAIKHITLPLTDVPFFCFSMCRLATMGQSAQESPHF